LNLAVRGVTGDIRLYLSVSVRVVNPYALPSNEPPLVFYLPLNFTVNYPTDSERLARREVYITMTCPDLSIKSYGTLVLTFRSDSNNSANDVSSPYPATGTVTRSDFLFFSDVPCLAPGFFYFNGQCRSCDDSKQLCVGGGRSWYVSFWSW
jgi:hypothetical protein